MPFYVGLDLGQLTDYTALAIVESRPREELHLRHLERYALRTPYPVIADHVAALIGDERLITKTGLAYANGVHEEAPALVVDATGVGTAVLDLLRERGLWITPITITGGDRTHRTPIGWRVPKRELVAALEVPFQSGKLKVAEQLILWPALKEELLLFRRKIDKRTAHDTYQHWRATDHDDLVLASALACWEARRRGKRLEVLKGGTVT